MRMHELCLKTFEAGEKLQRIQNNLNKASTKGIALSLSVRLCVYLFDCLTVCLSVCLSVCVCERVRAIACLCACVYVLSASPETEPCKAQGTVPSEAGITQGSFAKAS